LISLTTSLKIVLELWITLYNRRQMIDCVCCYVILTLFPGKQNFHVLPQMTMLLLKLCLLNNNDVM
jgi:hypothetical protein